MVVQTNIAAMNGNRMLGITSGKQAKSAEKLGSGYKINRAADDAAGLAISEKMRTQMRGLDRASTNAQDGISAAQTAEGALAEVQDMLQRMNELAVQAANGTNSKGDREAIQAEIEELSREVDRVAESTRFNETVLLNGVAGTSEPKDIPAQSAGLPGTLVGPTEAGKYEFTPELPAVGDKISIGGKTYEVVDGNSIPDPFLDNMLKLPSPVVDTDAVDTVIGKMKAELSIASGSARADIPVQITWTAPKFEIEPAKVNVPEALNVSLHVGSSSNLSNKIEVTIDALNAKGLGISGINVADETGTAATYAIDTIGSAIESISMQRGALGAIQNRLEHTIANLDNVVENTTAAESRIRDTDMAEEMVEYSKNNILMQAGQSMLAQANQSTQGVLSLLQ